MYVQLPEEFFKDQQEYVSKVAKTETHACALIDAGFEYVCDYEGHKIFQKTEILKTAFWTNPAISSMDNAGGGIRTPEEQWTSPLDRFLRSFPPLFSKDFSRLLRCCLWLRLLEVKILVLGCQKSNLTLVLFGRVLFPF
jgi:hypothetical protein